MDFSYSEEQNDIRNLAWQILGDQCTPERLKALDQQDVDIDKELWRAMADAGLTGIALDEQHGGMGFDFESLCILLEEVGRHCAKLPVLPVLVGACLPLQRFASSEQQAVLLPAIIRGDKLVTLARIEPGNDDARAPQLRAETRKDGVILRGEKHCVPVAAAADHILLAARADDGELLIVLLDAVQDGFSLVPQKVTSGETYYQLILDGVHIANEQILARGDHATQWLQYSELHYQAALCAMAVGLCDRMMRMTASYTSEREQFGRPVATFQAVGHRMADCYKDVECLRLTAQQAIFQLNAGLDAREAVTVAKLWCGDVCHRVSQAAQHCHGGIGVDRDYPLFRYCLMARQIELTAGPSAALLADLGDQLAQKVQQG